MIDLGLEELIAAMIGLVYVSSIWFIGMYIFMAFAFKAMAKKANLKNPNLAWIPFVGPLILAFQASKMHWWPWLLLIGTVIPFLNFITGIVFMVFAIIWHWKLFEAIKKPGWWAILMLVPIANIIVIALGAWGKK
jgi:magnesium-transporting ATPase (P-type)